MTYSLLLLFPKSSAILFGSPVEKQSELCKRSFFRATSLLLRLPLLFPKSSPILFGIPFITLYTPKRGCRKERTGVDTAVSRKRESLGRLPTFGRIGERQAPKSTSPVHNQKEDTVKGILFLVVDRGGFGPPKSGDDRFTVCSLWPLGNLPIFNYVSVSWWAFGDSNPGPAGYEPDALTN